MADNSLICHQAGCNEPVTISDEGTFRYLLTRLRMLYQISVDAGERAVEYWSDAAASDHPLAPLAHIPGAFAALWTPEVAPSTALTLATAGYGFVALPKHLIHFTTQAGARGIYASGVINSSRLGTSGIFGPGVYMARTGLPLNGFIKQTATVPILLNTPGGTVRIVPRLVYVRWGFSGVKIAP